MEFSPRDRILSLAAVIAAAFGVGVAFGIGFPLTSLTLEAWQAPKWVIGIAGAAPSLAVLLVLPFLPAVVGRIGAVRAIVSMSAMASLGFLVLGLAQDAATWIAVRFVMSAGLALPWLVGETWVNTVTTEAHRGRVIALYAIAFFAGFSSGPQVLDVLRTHGHWAPFIAGAIGTAMAGLPILLARRLAPDLTHDRPMPVVSAMRLAPVGMLGGLIGGFAEMSYLSLLPNVVMADGYSETEAGSLLSLMTLGGGVLQFVIGWMADKADRVRTSLVLAIAFIVLSAFFPLALQTPVAGQVMAFALGGVILGFYTVGLAIVGEQVAGKDLAAANAAFLVMYQVGAILGPVVSGAAMMIAPVAGFIASVCVMMGIAVLVLVAVMMRAPPHG